MPRIDALPLIERTDDALEALLVSLESQDWEKRAVGRWSVRDVAAHLLDGNVRRLSLARDGLVPASPERKIAGHEDLVAFLDQLNEEWTRAARRLSGRVLTDLLSFTNPQVRTYFESLDPDGAAPFPVSWAGQQSDRVWLDIAREYTEKWHHQQQIRDAVGQPGLREGRFVKPLLDTLVLALPRAYESLSANDGTCVAIATSDLPGAVWSLIRSNDRWQITAAEAQNPAAAIEFPSETMWRFLMKGIDADQTRQAATLSGDVKLLDPFFRAVAVMARRSEDSGADGHSPNG